eukprot:comp22812_c0_seq2/m.35812 comp22812_c0_seq2/g.35812  ORF comp22812_c0_seq2/g.35812 comp22812_c0_seq2/m.35812 type:complete len:373 (-) comp22812_c0_seq2:112-1230(-)
MQLVKLYLSVPVFFRAPAILISFLLLWAINIVVFKFFDINFALVLGMSQDESMHESEVFKAVLALTIMLSTSMYVAMNFATWPYLADFAPFLFYVAALYMFFTSRQRFFWKSRMYLLSVFRKVFSPFISNGQRISFSEVFITDALTSLSKVLGDLEIILCVVAGHVVSRQDPDVAAPGCVHSFLLPLVISVPFVLRCKQCYVEYRATKLPKDMLNFFKYATAFPAIWTGFLLKTTPGPPEELWNLWVLCTTINTLYSFVWDVLMDWGLMETGSGKFPLRETTMFPSLFYYVAVCLDLLLRFTWAIQLSSLVHLSSEGMTLLFELLEIARRAMWNLFRVEYEYVKTHSLSAILKQHTPLNTPERESFSMSLKR